MNDREILVPEAEGKTVRSMKLMLTSASRTEMQINFTDGTSFSSSTSPRTEFDAELYIGGTGEPQILRRYGNE